MARVLTATGILLALISGYFIYIAFGIETTIVSAETPAGFDGVANLQRMHQQTLLMLIGIGAGIASAVLIAGGEICDRLDGSSGK